MKAKVCGIALAVFSIVAIVAQQTFVKADSPANSAGKTRLAVVWTSGDSEVAHKMCFMYTQAAKRAQWFDEVVLVVWGPSSRLLAGDKELQASVKKMIAAGVVVQACVACADMYGVADTLREIDIEVKPMGRPLSDMLKADWKVLTF